MKAKLPINIVYTNRGTLGIENQTRYSTEAILAIANAIEEFVHPTAPLYRPKGAVLCLVDWGHRRPPAFSRRYNAVGVVENVSVKQYVTLRDYSEWDIIRIVPPENLFSDPIEAISWDGQFAPLDVTRQLAQRLTVEMGLPVWDMEAKLSQRPELKVQLPVMPERGSRKRGANKSVGRASRAERSIRVAYRRAYHARWAAHAGQNHLKQASMKLAGLRPDLAERLDLRRQELGDLYGRLIDITQDLNDICNTINSLDLTRKE